MAMRLKPRSRSSSTSRFAGTAAAYRACGRRVRRSSPERMPCKGQIRRAGIQVSSRDTGRRDSSSPEMSRRRFPAAALNARTAATTRTEVSPQLGRQVLEAARKSRFNKIPSPAGAGAGRRRILGPPRSSSTWKQQDSGKPRLPRQVQHVAGDQKACLPHRCANVQRRIQRYPSGKNRDVEKGLQQKLLPARLRAIAVAFHQDQRRGNHPTAAKASAARRASRSKLNRNSPKL